MIVCLVGYSGCGKDAVAKQLNGFDYTVQMSDIIKQMSAEKGTALGSDVRANDDLYKKLDNALSKDALFENVLLLGVREKDIIQYVKQHYVSHVLYLDATERTRFNRLMQHRHYDTETCIKKDITERQIGLTALVNSSLIDKTVNADQELEYVVSECNTILDRVRRL